MSGVTSHKENHMSKSDRRKLDIVISACLLVVFSLISAAIIGASCSSSQENCNPIENAIVTLFMGAIFLSYLAVQWVKRLVKKRSGSCQD